MCTCHANNNFHHKVKQITDSFSINVKEKTRSYGIKSYKSQNWQKEETKMKHIQETTSCCLILYDDQRENWCCSTKSYEIAYPRDNELLTHRFCEDRSQRKQEQKPISIYYIVIHNRPFIVQKHLDLFVND